jgi:hypothetical protein
MQLTLLCSRNAHSAFVDCAYDWLRTPHAYVDSGSNRLLFTKLVEVLICSDEAETETITGRCIMVQQLSTHSCGRVDSGFNPL